MRVLLTGAGGMVGRNVAEVVASERPDWTLLTPRSIDLNLLDEPLVRSYFETHKPDAVIHCAAKVGGIQANINDPVGFLYENMEMNFNLIRTASTHGVQKFINFGSSCMYPKDFRQPLVESDILAAPLEPTNEGYAIAKIASGKLCEYISRQHGLQYRTLIPCNLYGPYDHFDPVQSHLIPAILLKLHQAKVDGHKPVQIWGDGSARREFLFARDLAGFVVDLVDCLENCPDVLNVGYGSDHTVLEYYRFGAEAVGYKGEFEFDTSKPVGMMQKLIDSSLATQRFGWNPSTSLAEGFAQTYDYYLTTTK